MRITALHIMALAKGFKISDSQVWDVLDRIRSTIGFSHAKFAGLLQLTRAQYEKLRHNRISPHVASFLPLLEATGLGFDRVMIGDVDYMALGQRFSGNRSILPERYSIGAFSKRRSSIEIIAFLDMTCGWRYTDVILRHLEMDRSAFATPEKLISLNFLRDLCARLAQSGFGHAEFYQIGTTTPHSSSAAGLRDHLREVRNMKEFYDYGLNQLTPYFDTNFRYHVYGFRGDSCVLDLHPREEVQEALKSKKLGSLEVCHFRRGRAASFSGFAGVPHARVEEIQCVHRGDLRCRMKIDYSGLDRMLRAH